MSPKRPHDVTSQKTNDDIFTTVRTYVQRNCRMTVKLARTGRGLQLPFDKALSITFDVTYEWRQDNGKVCLKAEGVTGS